MNKGASTAAATSGTGQQLLFYAGVAALGIAGVVEWPIAAAIAAGTYIAAKSRQTPAPSPADTAQTPVVATGGRGVGVATPIDVVTDGDIGAT